MDKTYEESVSDLEGALKDMERGDLSLEDFVETYRKACEALEAINKSVAWANEQVSLLREKLTKNN